MYVSKKENGAFCPNKYFGIRWTCKGVPTECRLNRLEETTQGAIKSRVYNWLDGKSPHWIKNEAKMYQETAKTKS